MCWRIFTDHDCILSLCFFVYIGLDVPEPNPPSTQLQVGQNITITVNISGSPVPSIASFVRDDGQNIPDKGNRVSIVGSSITFRDLTEDDVGRYTITVSNGAIERVVFFEMTQQRECNKCTVYLYLLCVLFTVPTEKANAQHTCDAWHLLHGHQVVVCIL